MTIATDMRGMPHHTRRASSQLFGLLFCFFKRPDSLWIAACASGYSTRWLSVHGNEQSPRSDYCFVVANIGRFAESSTAEIVRLHGLRCAVVYCAGLHSFTCSGIGRGPIAIVPAQRLQYNRQYRDECDRAAHLQRSTAECGFRTAAFANRPTN